MTNEEIAAMAAALKAVTDRLTVLDAIIKSEKLGQPKVMAFRCSHSGLFFPPDYVKEWGHTVGIGLGSEVCSESLNTMYTVAPPPVESVASIDDLMHPVENSLAQVDLVVIPQEDYEANKLILQRDDRNMQKRTAIVRQRQLKNPASRTAAFMAQYLAIKGGAL